MADIYLASQVSMAGFEKLIVIKRILPNLAREERFVQMFLDEARIAALLNHPNVVQIFDLGRVENQFFIAMEYLAGESLSMLIKTCRRKNVVLPHNLAGSDEAFRFLAEEISTNTYLNVMAQYRPCFKAVGQPGIGDRLSQRDYLDALELARKNGLRRLD